MKRETQSIRVQTINFGDLDVPKDKVIEFKEGLPGFPQSHRFTILEFEELKPFQYLQALDEPPIALLVVNPFLVDPGYEFQLVDSDMADIECARTEDLSIYVVATIPEDPEEATINLMAPVIINERVRRGKQVILHDSNYSVRHLLFKGREKRRCER